MSGALLVLLVVAAVNPPRTRIALPDQLGGPAAGVGLGLSVAVVAAIASSSGTVLDILEISPETFLIATGLVAVIAGTVMSFSPEPRVEPPLAGWRVGVWPVAFPLLLSPQVLLLAVALPGQVGVWATVVAHTVAFGLAIGLALFPGRDLGRRLLASLGVALGAVLVVGGIWAMIEGIRDV